MDKPLQLNNLFVYVAVNYLATIQAVKSNQIKQGEEVSEPIIVMATNVEVADWVLKHSTIGFNIESDMHCTLSHYLLDKAAIVEYKPLSRLVTYGHPELPFYLNN